MARALVIALLVLVSNVRCVLALAFTDETRLPHRGTLGQPFELQLQGRNGSPPYHYKKDSGDLPPGLALSPDGVITGTPTAPGTFWFWGNLIDSTGRASQRPITITIDDPNPPAGSEKPGWKLTFADEFNGVALDPDKWEQHYRGNQSLPANAIVKDGGLHLRIDQKLPTTRPGANDRVSGIETRKSKQNFAQQYGLFEIRARCPKGSGYQAAFWLSPLDGEYSKLTSEGGTRKSADEATEIDIFEQLGKNDHANNFTVHYGGGGSDEGSDQRHVVFPFSLTTDFHVYSLQWDKKVLIWLVDGKPVHRSDKPPQSPFFIRLSVYEGDGPWRGAVSRPVDYPKDFEIDYVRVYQSESR